MTNAEKYLKDGVEAKEIWHNYQEFLMNNDKTENACTFVEFMEEKVKLQLTEDERVILKNIQNSRYGYTHIARTQADEEGNSDLYIFNDNDKIACDNIICFDHLFRFIKERRRIWYRGVAK